MCFLLYNNKNANSLGVGELIESKSFIENTTNQGWRFQGNRDRGGNNQSNA